MRLFPQEGNHVISFTGGATLNYSGIGQLKAGEIFFWLKEMPPAAPADQPRVQPDRMMARKQAVLDSPQLSAAVEQLEVWFEQKESAHGTRWKSDGKEETRPEGVLDNSTSARPVRPNVAVIPTGGSGQVQQRTAYRQPLSAADVNSYQLAGAQQQYQAGQQAPFAGPSQSSSTSRTQASPRYPRYLAQPSNQGRAGATPPSAVPGSSNQGQTLPQQSDAGQQRFKITGRILRARVQIDNQQSNLAEVMIEDGVRLDEMPTAQTSEQPISIQGDRLHGTNVSSLNAAVSVVGRPAHFEGRGLGLTGSNINLDRGANRLWIEGPGRMDLPLSGNAAGPGIFPGQSAAPQGTLFIEWKKNMVFEGRTAKFTESVSAATPQQHVQTETLEVRLKNPISFSNSDMQNQSRTELEELRCYNGVYLENRSVDDQQQLTSYDRMQVADLAVNMISGALTAGGPGWLNSVNLGSSDGAQNRFAAGMFGGGSVTETPGGAAAAQSHAQLNCLHVRFQGSITGNILSREITFHEQISAAYAPVADWSAMIDPTKPETLGPQGISLHCEHLKVNQMPVPSAKSQTIELESLGNALVEGGIFTATAQRISYAEAKDLLILEGDGRTDAATVQAGPTWRPVSTFSARKIIYRPKTNRLEVDGAHSLEINQGN